MKSLYSILDTRMALMLLLIALVLMISQTVVFLLALREKRSRRQIIVSTLYLLAGFLFFIVMLDGYDIINYPSIPRDSIQIDGFIHSLPWAFCVMLEVVSALILLIHLKKYRHYRRTTLTSDAIRQSVDQLPEGICVSAQDGTALLVNLKMDSLCRVLTGERISDAQRFWTYLEQVGEDQEGKRLIHTPQDEVWLFGKDDLTIEGREYGRMSAVNVTERYRITEELREKNVHLQDLQRRMKEASQLSGEMFIKQEEANARSALHNQLGQVLLMGRYYLEHPESTDSHMVALTTSQMNKSLLNESKVHDSEDEDKLQQAIWLAGSIGVSVEINGSLPQDKELRNLLAKAIRECAANTVKHAEGDKLNIEITKESMPSSLVNALPDADSSARTDEKRYGTVIIITNNGNPPKDTIAESGGLLALRRSVEAFGGRMEVQSQPRFILTISYPDS